MVLFETRPAFVAVSAIPMEAKTTQIQVLTTEEFVATSDISPLAKYRAGPTRKAYSNLRAAVE
jgi:hypothetical protein